MIALNNIRKSGAILFEIISILIIAFYSSPQLVVDYHSAKNNKSFFRIDTGNPIVYYKASENLSFTESLPKVQAVEHGDWDISFDLASLEISTSEALHVASYLHNVFYVFTSINAP